MLVNVIRIVITFVSSYCKPYLQYMLHGKHGWNCHNNCLYVDLTQDRSFQLWIGLTAVGPELGLLRYIL